MIQKIRENIGLFGIIRLFKFKKKIKPDMNAEIKPEVNYDPRFDSIDECLRKIDRRQKETVLQLEEINELLQDNKTGGNILADTVIDVADRVEEFYRFTVEDGNVQLSEQAQMMWNAVCKSLVSAGFKIIGNANQPEPFNFQCHSAEGIVCDNNVPNEYVLKTLKCGYIYEGEIIRRASVIVNKNQEV